MKQTAKHISPLFALFLLLLLPLKAMAQEGFDLKEKNGHYFFDATVNGLPLEDILLETGATGFHIREKDFDKIFAGHSFERSRLKGTRQTILGASYKVKDIWWAEFDLGDAHFRGNIFVTENSFPFRAIVNLHYLTNASDSTRNVIKTNFAKRRVDFVGYEDLDTTQLCSFDVVEFRPHIVVNSRAIIEQYGKKWNLKGRYIVDFGNVNGLTLCDNQMVTQFTQKSGIQLKASEDGFGRPCAVAFCNKITFGHKSLKDQNMMIAKINYKEELGLIGLRIFDDDIYIDTQRKKIYFK